MRLIEHRRRSRVTGTLGGGAVHESGRTTATGVLARACIDGGTR